MSLEFVLLGLENVAPKQPLLEADIYGKLCSDRTQDSGSLVLHGHTYKKNTSVSTILL